MKLPSHLVLSGGGVHGILILKALSTIESVVQQDVPLLHSLKLQSISASSIGSIIGCALLCDYTIKDIIDTILIDIDINSIFQFNIMSLIQTYGAHSQDILVSHIQRILDKKYCDRSSTVTFQDIYNDTKCTFHVCVTNMHTRSYELWNHTTHPNTPLLIALQISSCIPFAFPPVLYNGQYYLDGGLLNNFPHDNIMEYREDTLGICIDHTNNSPIQMNNIEAYAGNVIDLLYTRDLKVRHSLCSCNDTNTIFIRCPLLSFYGLTQNDLFNVYLKYKVDLDSLKFFK